MDTALLSRQDFMRLQPLWSSLAQDIVLTTLPNAEGSGPLVTPQEICQTYGITPSECVQILKHPEFKRLVTDFKKRVQAMGDNAAITLRAQMLATKVLEDVVQQALRPHTELKDKIKVMERLFQYGGLDPATNGTSRGSNEVSTGAAVATVVINVPAGIPGMEHITKNQTLIGEVQDVTDAS